MTLSARLWVWGGAVPTVVVGLVLLMADRAFHTALERSVDQALLTQAAIESVSLFDGPRSEPHLHMASSPLVETVRPFAPEGVLFGPHGDEVMRYPPPLQSMPSERLVPADLGGPPVLATVEKAADRHRQLVVSVRAPSGEFYALRLTASLAQVDASARRFHLVAIGATLLTAFVLVMVQALQGRGLRRRLATLRGHLEAVRAGELNRRPAVDTTDDEVSSIHEVLGQATARLQLARDARERLLADAAHELRTPLSLMRTRLDLALRRERPPDELRTALTETKEEVIRLASLATRLLETVALSQGPLSFESVDLMAVSRAGIEAFGHTTEVSVVLEGPERLCVSGHAEMLRQVVDNLLSNARKVAPPRSTITIRVSGEADAAQLSVCDEGPGIALEERENVFEPFHRVRGSPPGTGLGLSIVREIARRHGGRAWVGARPRGAELVVRLPTDLRGTTSHFRTSGSGYGS